MTDYVFSLIKREELSPISKVRRIMEKRVFDTSIEGVKLYGNIGEYLKYNAADLQPHHCSWGIGFSLQKLQKVTNPVPVPQNLPYTYQEYLLPSNEKIDLSSFSFDELFILTPTEQHRRRQTILCYEGKYPRWIYKGVSCQWLYAMSSYDRASTMNSLFPDEREPLPITKIGLAKTDKDIEKWLRDNAYSWRNEYKGTTDKEQNSLF